ncbi:MAG: histidine kinase [Flavobacteriales bacterium]|nr:histidine kinase [Flavobacteriales bacterium]
MWRRLVLVVWLMGTGPWSVARSPVFRSIQERDGLSNHDVLALHRDVTGALWIGTAHGLDRYDGDRITNFSPDDGLPSPTIKAIASDAAGMLWMATLGGVTRMDPHTWRMESWRVSNGADPVRNNMFMHVLPLGDRVLCTSEGGLWWFDPRDASWSRPSPRNADGLVPFGSVLRADSGGTGCWISTRDRGLVYYDVAREVLHDRKQNPGAHPLLEGLHISAMCTDRDGNLWLSEHLSKEIIHYRVASRRLERWKHWPGHPEAVIRSGARVLACDAAGRLWYSGWDFLPRVFDPVARTLIDLVPDQGDPTTIPFGFIHEFHEDERGLIWLATPNGIAVHDPSAFQYQVIDPGRHFGSYFDMTITGIATDEMGAIWTSSEAGLVRYDPGTGGYEHMPSLPGPDAASKVLSMSKGDGVFWLGTRHGLYTFDPRSRRSVPVELLKGRDPARVPISKVHVDRQGGIWVFSWSEGLFHHDPATGSTEQWPHGWDPPRGFSSGIMHSMLEAADGSIWLGHIYGGIVRYDPAKRTFAEVLRTGGTEGGAGKGPITALAEDARGNIWYFSQGFGLFSLDPGSGAVRRYGMREGLPSLSGWNIVPDSRGRLWLGTGKGLACFDPVAGRATPIRLDHGLSYHDMPPAHAWLPSGELLMADGYTLVRFDPGRFVRSDPPPAPVVRSLLVNGERVPLSGEDPIRLEHGQDRITIRFSSFDLPGRITRYATRRVGDTTWVEGPTGTFSLSGLNPAEYEFRFRTMSDTGVWSEESGLRFIIAPPWWQRLWARVLFALLIAASIVLLFRLRLNLIRSRERKEESVARTMNDLKLRALRAQMNPHFVFNCMNSIDKYILMNEPEQASRYLNRFAKLVRLILNQSDSVSVPLDKEVEMLRYYLELEALRFEEPFTFEVTADPLLMNEDPELPAMLVQPYVENAIWHGLQHKHGRGHIRVDFRKLGNDLVVTVEDNGVGRAEAARIKAQRSTVHSSKAMQVNADRMRLMEELKLGGASVAIDDLTDREGKALGTRVTITLPLEALREGVWMEEQEA